jgi:hypothetical protein
MRPLFRGDAKPVISTALVPIGEPMPRLVTVKQFEGLTERAKDYVKAYILFPSGILGLLSMVGGTGALGYQLIATESYTWATFWISSALLLFGGGVGWAQTRYHQYIFHQHPEVFASRMKPAAVRRSGRAKKEAAIPPPEAPGAKWVPLGYLAGMGILLAISTMSMRVGQVHPMAAYLMPWGGFFWAKLYFWRAIIKEGR